MKPSLARMKELVTVGPEGANVLMDKGWVLLSVSEKDGRFQCCMGSRAKSKETPGIGEAPPHDDIIRLCKYDGTKPKQYRGVEAMKGYLAPGVTPEDEDVLARALNAGMMQFLLQSCLKMSSEHEEAAR